MSVLFSFSADARIPKHNIHTMQKKSSKTRQRKRNNYRGEGAISMFSNNTYMADPVLQRKFRFRQTQGSGDVSVTRGQMLRLLGMANAAASPVTTRIFDAVRVRRVKMLGADASAATTSSTFDVYIRWVSENGPSEIIQTAGNAFSPPTISSTPPEGSLAGYWSVQGANETTVLFIINCPQESIIDVEVEFTMQTSTTITVNANSAWTSAGVRYNYLDSAGAGTGILQPYPTPLVNPNNQWG
jgi:hypothetical protein